MVNVEFILNTAEIGDYLYIIIFAILMLVGVFEKIAKAKRQQQNTSPRPSQPYDDFGDVEQPAPPQTIEDVLRRMMQTAETHGQEEEFVGYPEEAQSLEVIPDTPRFQYQPLVCTVTDQAEKEAFSSVPIEEEIKVSKKYEFQFDIRQAVIASEILNRKY